MLQDKVSKLYSSLYNSLSRVMIIYEDYLGVTEMKIAQKTVLKIEKDFMQVQSLRRDVQKEVNSMTEQRNDIIQELENTPRGKPRFLELITKEHEIINKESELRKMLDDYESKERATLTLLSSNLRDSHEKERNSRAKKDYVHSIQTSVICIIGFLGAIISNYWRHRDIKILMNSVKSIDNVQKSNSYKEVEENQLILTEIKQVNQKIHSLEENISTASKSAVKTGDATIQIQEHESDIASHQQTIAITSEEKKQLENSYKEMEDKMKKVCLTSASLMCVSGAVVLILISVPTATSYLFS